MKDTDSIRLLAMDVDGTLTDGMLYFDEKGECLKAFHVKDGMGIHLAQEFGIVIAIITGRNSKIVSARAKELGITEVLQDVRDKRSALEQLAAKYHLGQNQIAYVGDDINDLPALRWAAVRFAPADCHPDILPEVDVYLKTKGGQGAVRECIDIILRKSLSAK